MTERTESRIPLPRPDDKVVIAYLSPGMVNHEFHECLLQLAMADAYAGVRRLADGGGRLAIKASANLAGPRNEAVRIFLEQTQAPWFLWLDTDMTFEVDLLERLMAVADPERAPIVGGLCFGIDHGIVSPTLYDFAEVDGQPEVVRYNTYPLNAVMPVAATGTACLLIHRSVFVRMAAEPPTTPGFSAAYPWFQEREFGKKMVSEDITFCWRAGLLGYPLFVNTGAKLGHEKTQLLTEDTYLAQLDAFKRAAAAEPDEVRADG